MATKCWADDGLYAVAISPARTKTKMRKSLYPGEDQTTLLEPADFAKVISKAVNVFVEKSPRNVLCQFKNNIHEVESSTMVYTMYEFNANYGLAD